METKRKITVLVCVTVFAGLLVCPALARRYDTNMFGTSRWIDIDYIEKPCQLRNYAAVEEPELLDPIPIAMYEGQDNEPNYPNYEEPNIITYYDGFPEPNTLILIYYPEQKPEHPEDPNEFIFEEEIAVPPQLGEHPEHPNSVDWEEDIDPNNMIASAFNEHPEEPNEISSQTEHPEPNDIEKIIMDEGTALDDRSKPKIASTE